MAFFEQFTNRKFLHSQKMKYFTMKMNLKPLKIAIETYIKVLQYQTYFSKIKRTDSCQHKNQSCLFKNSYYLNYEFIAYHNKLIQPIFIHFLIAQLVIKYKLFLNYCSDTFQ